MSDSLVSYLKIISIRINKYVYGVEFEINGLRLQEVGDFYHKCSYEERMFD